MENREWFLLAVTKITFVPGSTYMSNNFLLMLLLLTDNMLSVIKKQFKTLLSTSFPHIHEVYQKDEPITKCVSKFRFFSGPFFLIFYSIEFI